MIRYATKDNRGINIFPAQDFLTLKRCITLTGEINSETALNVAENMLLMAAENTGDITMIINSPGGSIDAGLMIYDVMRGCGCDIRTVCLGECYSMGAFLLAAGTNGKRCITKHGRVMIHEPQLAGGLGGSCSSVEEISKTMVNTKNMINEMLASFCGKTPQEVDEAVKSKNYFMDAESAVKFGLVDCVLDSNLINEIIGEAR